MILADPVTQFSMSGSFDFGCIAQPGIYFITYSLDGGRPDQMIPMNGLNSDLLSYLQCKNKRLRE